MTVQAEFLCDLPNYKPFEVAIRAYERIGKITTGTHIIGVVKCWMGLAVIVS